jgi:hypothetical protein
MGCYPDLSNHLFCDMRHVALHTARRETQSTAHAGFTLPHPEQGYLQPYRSRNAEPAAANRRIAFQVYSYVSDRRSLSRHVKHPATL